MTINKPNLAEIASQDIYNLASNRSAPDNSKITGVRLFPGRAGISVKELCSYAGIGRTLAYQILMEGKIKSRLVGRRRVVNLESAARFFAGDGE